jgi:hypothetical protein
MPTQDVELEMEDLLLRNVPGLAEQWQGSTPDEIAQIEQLAGRQLPAFYRWFLTRMGQSMGPLAYPTLDFSAQRVLSCYAKEMVVPDSRFLLIAYESDEMMPLHIFYDFDATTREDALVTARHARGGELHDSFETLREMLAWGALFRFRVGEMPQMCNGRLYGEHPDSFSLIDPVMNSLGFMQPIPTGPYCRLYERPDAAMICRGMPREGLDEWRTFKFGGSNAGSLRKILGKLATETSLEVEVKDWAPELR